VEEGEQPFLLRKYPETGETVLKLVCLVIAAQEFDLGQFFRGFGFHQAILEKFTSIIFGSSFALDLLPKREAHRANRFGCKSVANHFKKAVR
jgi:hypothetical protein